ncbi:MAG: hypothetical protein SH859_02880 [Hyphomicrobium aestuarii]|nr:hypothetical protein [Hyphomicrobium aestuarii]
MSANTRSIVAIIFVVLGMSFIVTTAVLYTEFRDHDWFTLATLYSHLFVFFPTFGLLALFAFYIPACALLDLYWNNPKVVRYGRLRFALGTTVLILMSVLVARALVGGDLPAIWWLKPQTLAADRGDPAGCVTDPSATQSACLRHPILESVAEVRRQSEKRNGLSVLVRQCDPDPLIETPRALIERRYCFVTKTMLSAAECCQAQTRFSVALTQIYANDGKPSVTSLIHSILLPLKIFFLLMILAIGFLLAMWRRTIDKLYHDDTAGIERGILIGAFAMLIWPISNQSFLQSSSLLYGKYGDGFYSALSPVMSGLFVIWVLLLVVFFFRRTQRDIEAAGKIGGGIASLVFALKYQEIIDYATRFLGSGANAVELVVMGALLLTGLVVLTQTTGAQSATAAAESGQNSVPGSGPDNNSAPT